MGRADLQSKDPGFTTNSYITRMIDRLPNDIDFL